MIYHDITYPDFQGAMFTDNAQIISLIPSRFKTRPASLEGTYRISAIANKGAGMLANQDIPMGGSIVVENPMLIHPCIISTKVDRNALFDALYARLAPDIQAKALSLWNCKPPHVCGKLEGILRSNGIEVELPVPDDINPEDTPHSGTFLDISRCNHRSAFLFSAVRRIANFIQSSCGPNAGHHWDVSTFSMLLYATRPIKKDEEITIQYTNLLDSRDMRREILLDQYKFHCECEYCNLPDHHSIAASDAARLELARWSANKYCRPQAWCRNLELDDHYLVEALSRIIALHEQEQVIDSEYVSRVGDLAIAYGMLADEANFMLWGRRMHDILQITKAAPNVCALWERWLVEPLKSLSVWNLRNYQKTNK